MAAKRAAELVSLQAVLYGCEVVDRIHIAVTDKFKRVSMPVIRTGLGDDVDQAAGMKAVARRQDTGLYAELCERVGKWKRHVDVGEAVHVIAAVEQVIRGVASAAGDGDGLRCVEALVSCVGAIAVVHSAAG